MVRQLSTVMDMGGEGDICAYVVTPSTVFIVSYRELARLL